MNNNSPPWLGREPKWKRGFQWGEVVVLAIVASFILAAMFHIALRAW